MTPAESAVVDRLTPGEKVGLTLWGEARGGSEAAILAVGSAISNRAKAHNPRWGLTADAVCLKPYQFSCWSHDPNTTNDETVMAAARDVAAKRPTTSKLRLCLLAGEAIVAEKLKDTVSGATHYYNPAAMKPVGRVPSWAVGLKPVAEVGGHLFFAGVK